MSQFDEAEMDALDDERDMDHRAAPITPVTSVDADYYTIADNEDWPIAGLIVLLDRRRHAVRAELHLYEDGERQNEYALHTAQNILSNQYFSQDLVQLQVMQSYPWRETLELPATAAAATPETDIMAFLRQYWQPIAGASAIILLVLFIWFIASFFRSPEEIDTVETEPTSAVPLAGSSENAAEDGPAAAAPTTALAGAQTNGLPASRNADPNLAVGKRLRVLPNVAVSLVSQPENDQSLVIGFLDAGKEAEIFDGPVYKQGDSDTIVWWHVRLDDGREAWVPANTSNATLVAAVN
ncbi:MAG: SH3 domain-containing protein [Caldilineaceae bacterium]|nr:SH3 domain-containing protein [Caldilineaceae bacterium]